MRFFRVEQCRCQGAGYELRVCDPDGFAIPDAAIEVSKFFIARSVYSVPSFSEILLPYFAQGGQAIYRLDGQLRFWLLFPTVADSIAFKLTHL
jgi:hypothetical protein